jgi:arginase
MANISILGVPMDFGAGRRGVDMGASAIRLAKLAERLSSLGHHVHDLGNVNVPIPEAISQDRHFVNVIQQTCLTVYQQLRELPEDNFPIILGGDHAISMGTVAGVAKKRLGILWVDAHADLNTFETSPSGNVHGMPLAHLLGYGDERLLDIWERRPVLRPEDIVFIGLRSIDPAERAFINDQQIKAYTMKEIDTLGIAAIAREALDYLAHVDQLHVSFDADVLDPNIAPGVGTPVPGGLSFREAHLLMELFADARRVSSLDLVEVNPILDISNKTGQIMVEMCASLLGQRIL